MNQPRNLPQNFGFPALQWFGQAFSYRRDDNFGVGDIRRFVSVGSPFQGSPFGDNVSALLNWNGMILFIANTPGLSVDGTGVNDLGVLSRGTFILGGNQPVVSWYPIVGVGAPGSTQNDMGPNGAAMMLAMVNTSPADLGLLPENSDFVVNNFSQVDRSLGPFPPVGIQHTVVTSHTHTEEAGSVFVASHLLKALEEPLINLSRQS